MDDDAHIYDGELISQSSPDLNSVTLETPCKICHEFGTSTTSLIPAPNRQRTETIYPSQLNDSASDGCVGCSILWHAIKQYGYDVPGHFQFEIPESSLSVFLVVRRVNDSDNGRVMGASESVEFFRLNGNASFHFDTMSWDKRCLYVDALANFSCEDDQKVAGAGNEQYALSPALNIRHAVQWIQNCMNNCKARHRVCIEADEFFNSQANAQFPAPSRLLELRINDTGHIYLTDTDNITTPYMTLSHCWGTSPPLITTLTNISHRRGGIPVSTIPQTFRDAIEITRHLGIKYIWIDSLCIVQDDPSDWNVESGKMAAIYEGSYLNISATGSPDGKRGCFANDPDGMPRPVRLAGAKDLNIYMRRRIRIKESHLDLQNMSLGREHASVIRSSPLLSRAWAYQERLLSSRNVNFHREEMVFECTSSIACECGKIIDSSYQRRPNIARVRPPAPTQDAAHLLRLRKVRMSEWYRLVRQYTRLSVTYPKDRLPALAGLAKNFSLLLNDQYVAGLWASDLWYGLQWRIDSDRTVFSPRRAIARAPTWSWVSVEYRTSNDTESRSLPQPSIMFDGWSTERVEDKCEILSVRCLLLAPNNPFGEVVSGELKLSAKFLSLFPQTFDGSFQKVKFSASRGPSVGQTLGNFVIDVYLLETSKESVDSLRVGGEMWLRTHLLPAATASLLRCVSMGAIRTTKELLSSDGEAHGDRVVCLSHKCLLLRQVEEGRPIWERVGLGTVDDYEGLFDDASVQVFTII